NLPSKRGRRIRSAWCGSISRRQPTAYMARRRRKKSARPNRTAVSASPIGTHSTLLPWFIAGRSSISRDDVHLSVETLTTLSRLILVAPQVIQSPRSPLIPARTFVALTDHLIGACKQRRWQYRLKK